MAYANKIFIVVENKDYLRQRVYSTFKLCYDSERKLNESGGYHKYNTLSKKHFEVDGLEVFKKEIKKSKPRAINYTNVTLVERNEFAKANGYNDYYHAIASIGEYEFKVEFLKQKRNERIK